ncbi:hypothetical protein CPL00378_CDS0062 [Klebsiella phage AloofButler]
MPHTIATMRTSTKEQRRNRKRTLWDRIRKDIRRFNDEATTNRIVSMLKIDMQELIEIGVVEGYQQGRNDANNSKGE